MAEATESFEDSKKGKNREDSLRSNQVKKGAILTNHKILPDESGCDTSLLDGSFNAELDGSDLTANNSSELNLSLPKLEDSGIDVERSPVSNSAKDSGLGTERSPSLRDCSISELDLSESVSDCVTDSGCNSKTNSECNSHVKSEKRKNDNKNNRKVEAVADAIKNGSVGEPKNNRQMPGEMAEGSEVESAKNGEENDVDMVTKDSDDDDSEDDSDVAAFRKRPAKKRKYRFQRKSSESDDNETNQNEETADGDQSGMADIETDSELDSDDFTDDDEIEGSEESVKSKDQQPESEEEEEEENQVKPKHTWFALKDLSSRQMGFSNRTPPSIFREKVQGSLQMVQRLKLQYKMDYHEGCVNALSFNRIGRALS